MDEISLIVEGIQNKIKKLVARNLYLLEQNVALEKENRQKSDEIESLELQLEELKSALSDTQLSNYLKINDDPVQARQKVDHLLREIEKCYLLLKR